ncbi:MAG: hypothetical protein Q9187_000084 [Circinaria calcarea]
MAKKSKLLTALDAHKGRNYKVEKQKALQRKAEKKKKMAKQAPQSPEGEDGDEHGARLKFNAETLLPEEESDGWESDKSEDAPTASNIDRIDDSDSSISTNDNLNKKLQGTVSGSESEHGSNSGLDQDDIALSDLEELSDDDRADIIPHQRLTINNTSALIKAQKAIALPIYNVPFSEHQSITSTTQISIADVNDDLSRELAFHKQCLDAATEARGLLKKEGIPFSRPADYFAEMVKSDEHMGKIKLKMTDEAANKKAAAEARRQRDLKKFGKQVQVAKLQQRDKAKRDTLDKINILKRKRKDTDTGNVQEDDLFDVALENETKTDRSAKKRQTGVAARTPNKRQKKDAKFGFGGKKRYSKSGDAASSGDIRGFSSKKMKGQNTGAQRFGKSRRAKQS